MRALGLRVRGVSFPTVVSLLALFVALGGTGYAAVVLPSNSVGTSQLKKNAVTSGKVKDGSLKSVDFASGQVPAGPAGAKGQTGATGPAGPTGPTGVVDTTAFYSKVQSDARFLRSTVVVTARSGAITPGSFGSATASCPAGYQVIAGGVEPENVLTVVVTASEPLIAGQNLNSVVPGQFAAASGWRAFARNNAAVNETVDVAAICAAIG